MAEVVASGGRKEIWTSAQGTKVRDVAPEKFELVVQRRVDEQIAERDMSRAERRMADRVKKRPYLVQPVEIKEDGETEVWFVTAISDADFCEIGIAMASDGFTIADQSESAAQRSFNAASLYVALVVSEDDRSRYFESYEEAKDFYDDPRNVSVSLALRAAIYQVNPFLSPGAKKNEATVRFLPTRKQSRP